MMSTVHVFFKDKMVAVGHLVGADQLPLPQLVKSMDRCVTLDIKNGERAVLLKNHAGDWGVVLGHWTGMRKPVPAAETSSGRRGIPGDPGHLEVRFFKFSTRHWRFLSFERDYSGSEHKFQIEAATVELDSGLIEISSEAGTEVAENLALAFSVALLHVLCQPRPKEWDPSTEMAEDELDGQAAKARPRMAAEGLALIMAAGFLTLAPSNHLLRKRHREAMEAQAEEEARSKQREEEEERRRELASSGGGWGRHHSDDNFDQQDVASGSGVQDVVAIVSAEESAEDVPPVPGDSSRKEDQGGPEAVTKGVAMADSAGGDVSRGAVIAHQPHSPTGEAGRMRLPSIAESNEEEYAENSTETDTLHEEDGHMAQDMFDMSSVAKGLEQADSEAHNAGGDELSLHENPLYENDINSCFPLPVEELPLPSDDLLLPDDRYPLPEDDLPLPDVPDEDLPLPDVPDDDLPLPIEELPLPDMSRLNEPQAEALQMSSAYSYLGQGCDKAVGFDENSAVGFEEYLNVDTNQYHTDEHTNSDEGFSDNAHCVGDDFHDGVASLNNGCYHYENHIPQDDFRHFNGDLDHLDDHHHFNTNDQYEDLAGDFSFSARDANGEDHFDMNNSEDVNDMYVNETNYISYEDTNNYDGFYSDDFSCGGDGGGGDGEGGGGFFGHCGGGDVGGGETEGGGGSGAAGSAGPLFMFGDGDFGGDGGGAGCGGGANCGGGGAGCGGCGG